LARGFSLSRWLHKAAPSPHSLPSATVSGSRVSQPVVILGLTYGPRDRGVLSLGLACLDILGGSLGGRRDLIRDKRAATMAGTAFSTVQENGPQAHPFRGGAFDDVSLVEGTRNRGVTSLTAFIDSQTYGRRLSEAALGPQGAFQGAGRMRYGLDGVVLTVWAADGRSCPYPSLADPEQGDPALCRSATLAGM
jgi:hypothetical protein